MDSNSHISVYYNMLSSWVLSKSLCQDKIGLLLFLHRLEKSNWENILENMSDL